VRILPAMVTDVIKWHWGPPASKLSKIIQIRTGRQYVGYVYYSVNLNWAAYGPRVGHSCIRGIEQELARSQGEAKYIFRGKVFLFFTLRNKFLLAKNLGVTSPQWLRA